MFRCREIFKWLLISALSFAVESVASKSLVRTDVDLSNNAIITMYQDDAGNMWIGTYDGLHLYNGKDTSIYRMELDNESSLSSNIVLKIVPAEKGYIWVTTSLGINKFSLVERKVVKSLLSYVDVEQIASDDLGNTLFFAEQGAVSYYDPVSDRVIETSVREQSTDLVALWCEGDEVFCSMDNHGNIVEYRIEKQGNNVSVKNRVRHQIPYGEILKCAHYDHKLYFVTKTQKLYAYYCDGAHSVELADLSKSGEISPSVSAITLLHDHIYISLLSGALCEVPLAGGEASFTKVDYRLFSLWPDKFQDILWVGTDGYGVMMYCHEEESPFSTILLKDFPQKMLKPVRCLYADDSGDLWMGTKGGGVIRLSDYRSYRGGTIPKDRVRIFTHEHGLQGDNVFSMVHNRRWNVLWFGSSGHAISYYSFADGMMHQIELEEQGVELKNVHQMCQMNDSTLYVACDLNGLVELRFSGAETPRLVEAHKHCFKRGKHSCNDFYTLTPSSDSTLMLGLRGGYGLIDFNVNTYKYKFVELPNLQSRALGDVLSLCHSDEWGFFCGTSSGLITIHPENGVRQFDHRHGIINDMIHGVLEDNSNSVWLSTNKGLVQFNPNRHFFHNYSETDSELAVIEFCDDAYWRCPRTGRLFFGGVNGVVWIDPTKEKFSHYYPPLHFVRADLPDGKSIPLSSLTGEKPLSIKAHTPQFSVSFVAIDYLNGNNFEYSYFLEGYSQDWVELQKENKVTFLNLPSGTYKLHVRYRNGVMDQSMADYVLPIEVRFPWYRTLWAYAGAFLLFVGGLCAVLYLFRRHYRRKQADLVARLNEEQREKTYEARMNFFVNISHELCTPLTLINGMNERLAERVGDDPSLKKYTDVMHENVKGLNDLIQEILNFRKIEEDGFGDLAIQRVQLPELLRQQVLLFADAAQSNHIELKVDAPEHLVWATDPGFFKKIVLNLVSNALKYTPQNGRIVISVALLEQPSPELVLKVWNSGRGIAASQLNKVFDRYRILERMDRNMYTDSASRNGLGLYICRGLVRALKGQITVNSEEGKYAEFVVSLPLQSLSEDNQKSTSAQDGAADHLSLERTSEKPLILVVDDNKDILWLVQSALETSYRVQTSKNGREALERIHEETPDLIVTDIVMAQGSGLDLIDAVRADKYLRRIPIVVISAKITEGDQVEGLEMGADAYLTKPFSVPVLQATVSRLLHSRAVLKEYYNTAQSVYTVHDGQKMLQTDREFMDAVVRILQDNLESKDLSVESIADQFGLSARNFYRKFKRISGCTPSDFIKDFRFDTAASLLKKTDLTVTEIMYRVGISNKSYFYREFQKKFELKPKEFRTSADNQ